MNNFKITLTGLILLLFSTSLHAVNDSAIIAFYNVENLFDYFRDSTKNDQDFTPQGKKTWTKTRYETKINHTFKTIAAIGGFDAPAIVGLCEVENSKVLKDLTLGTPLRNKKYAYIHHEGNDPRGIDVALLYRKDKFKILKEYAIPVIYEGSTTSRTRDILYVQGILFKKDTIHLFINHFPSKLGGAAANEKRMYVAKLLRSKIDSILMISASANIIVMGDFNDAPNTESITKGLNAKCDTQALQSKDMINLMCPFIGKHKGSHKYRGEWSTIDQIIVSENLWTGNNIRIQNNKAYIFDDDFLLTEDKKNLGKQPFRTYNGPRYLGGFSDHLPVYIIMIND